MKVYSKNSFDRFGDDLTELILQYLTFEDKIRLECLSKQWQRCVYQRQFVITIALYNFGCKNSLKQVLTKTGTDGRKQLNEQHLESVLKKCPNIEEVHLCLEVNSSVLSLIGRYCPNIKSLTYVYINVEKSLEFFSSYGHKLEVLYLYKMLIRVNQLEDNTEKDNEMLNSFLKFCPNLKTISFPRESYPLFKDIKILPKLKEIYYLRINSENVNQMKLLSDKYSKTLKTLFVSLIDLTDEELKTCIECIARFENLKELILSISAPEITQPIDDCLSLIGQKCNKLLKLQFTDFSSTTKSNQFFKAITEFKAIKVLRISFIRNNTVLSGSVECFKHCKQLNELDINYPELREDFFANIVSFVPKLQLIKIKSDQQFPDSFINPFHSMKCIQSVELLGKYKSKHKIWYFRKRY